MVITEDEDVDTSDGVRDRRPTYLQVASVLQAKLQDAKAGTGDRANPALRQLLEFAAQEFGIERDDYADHIGRRKKSTEQAMASKRSRKKKFTCEHQCCDHKDLMNPNLWGTLPQELLQLIFARLPVDEISRLQFLNKDLQQTMTTPDSEFFRECDEVHPKLLCLITKDPAWSNKFWLRVLDTQRPIEWRTYQIVAGYPEYLDWTLECEDGGLVCFVTYLNRDSLDRDTHPSLFLNVANPLKRTLHELPPLCDIRANFFQMKVDRRTKAYKVFVVADRVRYNNAVLGSWTSTGITVQIYDSVMDEWGTVHESSSDLIFSFRHKYTWGYDIAGGGQFLHLNGDGCPLGREFVSSARHNDHLFVLRVGSDEESSSRHASKFYIEEFRCQVRGMSWLKVKTHRCNPFEHPPKKPQLYYMKLFACSGYLMVFAVLSPYHVHGRFENKLAWLYDLLTSKWTLLNLPPLLIGRRLSYEGSQMFPVEVPGAPKWAPSQDLTYSVDSICELQWGV